MTESDEKNKTRGQILKELEDAKADREIMKAQLKKLEAYIDAHKDVADDEDEDY